MKDHNNPPATRAGVAPGALLPFSKIGLRAVRYDRRVLARFIAGTLVNENLVALPPPEVGDLVDEREAASILRVSLSTLRNWRCQRAAAAREAA